MDKVKELYAFEEEIYHYSFDEDKYLDKISEMVDFIYANFQEADELNSHYYTHKFEIELAKKIRANLSYFSLFITTKPFKKIYQNQSIYFGNYHK